MKISVVAGCSKLHLFGTIAELNKHGYLANAYVPLGLDLSKGNPLRKIGIIKRATMRFPELQFTPKIQIVAPEIFYQAGLWLNRKSFVRIGELLTEISHRLFSLITNFKMRNDDCDVLIIRCGFGTHIKSGKRLRVCDLNMAHPLIDNSLISGKGLNLSEVSSIGRIARLMIEDLNRADKIIVNSDFIKKTCILAGIDGDKIEVAYLPPAHELIEISRSVSLNQSKTNKAKSVIFVGTLSFRKGIDIFLSVAKLTEEMGLDFQFTAIGSWSGVTAEFRDEFLSMPNINLIPWVSREELVEYYRHADFLLCPTRADGGARVITEAMLFGVVVLTTTVSGSPINSGYDGFEFDLEDQSEFMSKTIEVFEDEEISKEVGKHARMAVITNLTFEKYLTKILAVCS